MTNQFQRPQSSKHPLQASGMLTPQEFDSPAKVFMRAGKNYLENILKTQIENKKVADALADLVYQYHFFGLHNEEGPQMQYINTLVVCWAAVRSRASIFALQGLTQIMSEHLTASAAGFEVRDRDGRGQEDKPGDNNNKNGSGEAR